MMGKKYLFHENMNFITIWPHSASQLYSSHARKDSRDQDRDHCPGSGLVVIISLQKTLMSWIIGVLIHIQSWGVVRFATFRTHEAVRCGILWLMAERQTRQELFRKWKIWIFVDKFGYTIVGECLVSGSLIG